MISVTNISTKCPHEWKASIIIAAVNMIFLLNDAYDIESKDPTSRKFEGANHWTTKIIMHNLIDLGTSLCIHGDFDLDLRTSKLSYFVPLKTDSTTSGRQLVCKTKIATIFKINKYV